MAFTVATANVRKDLQGGALHDAITEAAVADILCVQEAESAAHVGLLALLPGYSAYFPGGAAAGATARNACPILWRTDRFELIDSGSAKVGDGIAKVQPNRPCNWVILKDKQDGGTVGVLSAHTVSGVWKNLARKFAQWLGRTRRQESDHELAAIATLTRGLKAKAGTVVGGGDLNRAAKITAATVGADRVVYAPGPTHGNRWFDVLWLCGAVASDARRIATPSDHKVLVATVVPNSSQPPQTPPPVKEKPVTAETRVVDYSFARPSPAAIAQAGYTAVGRYVAPGGSASKQVDAAERARLHGAGLALWLVYEATANRATAGFAAGSFDAKAALASANALGYPKACPIFFAVDFDAEEAAVASYFAAVRGVLGPRAGVYGGIKVANLAPWVWQTAAWSGGRLSPRAHLYQRVHMTRPVSGCDENVVCRPIVLDGPHGPATYVPGGKAPVLLTGKPGPAPKPGLKPGPVTRGPKVDAAMTALRGAGGASVHRRALLNRVRGLLASLVPWKK